MSHEMQQPLDHHSQTIRLIYGDKMEEVDLTRLTEFVQIEELVRLLRSSEVKPWKYFYIRIVTEDDIDVDEAVEQFAEKLREKAKIVKIVKARDYSTHRYLYVIECEVEK